MEKEIEKRRERDKEEKNSTPEQTLAKNALDLAQTAIWAVYLPPQGEQIESSKETYFMSHNIHNLVQ